MKYNTPKILLFVLKISTIYLVIIDDVRFCYSLLYDSKSDFFAFVY